MIFENIPSDDDIKSVIKSAFDVDLDLSGGWGYDKSDALVIHKTDVPLQQIEHTLASMRAFIEMNMTQPDDRRYGAINVNETARECISENNKIYDKITYEISGMLESEYEKFIEEYKNGYESPDFDLESHFKRRKAATVVFEKLFWFDITNVNK
jgi:hypothetical protein